MGRVKKYIKNSYIKLYAKQLDDIAKNVNKINGKRRFVIVADIIYSTLRYGASPNNYLNFKFYELEHSKRNTYVTHRISENMIKLFNDNDYREIFEDKTRFAEVFKDYFGREWLSLRDLEFDNFVKFIINKEKFIYKPIGLAQGQGIKKIETKNFKDSRHIYNYLKDTYGDDGIIEEWIVQHDEVSRLYNKSVNPVRIITVNNDGKCNILVAGLTIGNGRDISNASCNDLVSPIDINTGILKFPAVDSEGQIFDKHPITNEIIEGFKIPYWEAIIKLVEEASSVVPNIKYVGWDIAVTSAGGLL